MWDETKNISTPLLLGIPFMKTACNKIDIHNGTLTMEFDKEFVCFNIIKEMRYPNDINLCYYIDFVYSCVEHVIEQDP